MTESDHTRINRVLWNRDAEDYQRRNAPQIQEQAFTGDIAWGLWAIPESQLGVLGEVAGKHVLELGCGGAQWSTALARRGARPVGLDISERQLGHAGRLQQETGIRFPLVHADAERVPLRDASFDIVFADHGAFSFADPDRTVPESARVLRAGDRLVYDYFGRHRTELPDGSGEFGLPYG